MKNLLVQTNVARNNPCRMDCDPLNANHCLISLPESEAVSVLIDADTSPDTIMIVAKTICRLLEEANNLIDKTEQLEDFAQFWEQVAVELSVDADSGLITGNALPIVSSALFDSGLTESYRMAGYKLRILYADIDDLKQHNAGPGRHAQGDLAIKTVATAIGEAFTRKTDIKLLDSKVDNNIDPEDPHSLVSRSNYKGDEFVVFSFFDPNDPKRNGLDDALEFLHSVFTGLNYEYEGSVYPVNVSFGVADFVIPSDPHELSVLVKRVDSSMMVVKERDGKTNGTIGVAVEL